MRGPPVHVAVVLITVALLPGLIRSEDDEDVKLPSYFETCYRDDPKVSQCIKRNIENLAPMFSSGSKELDLDSLEPIHYKPITMVYGSSVAGGRLHLPNLLFGGITKNFKILDVRSNFKNPNKLSIDFDVHFSMLNINTDYKLEGNLVTIPIKVHGRLDGDLIDVDALYKIRGHAEEVGNSTVLVLDGFTWGLVGDGIQEVRVNNDDLVAGYPGLNQFAKTVVRTQWRTLRQNLMPSILQERQFALTDTFTNFFKKYPYDVLFPRRTRIGV